MESIEKAVMFSEEHVSNAVRSAFASGLLCHPCIEKIAAMMEGGEMVEQSDFCTSCQGAVTSYLYQALQERIKEVLKSMGMPEDAVQIGDVS